MQCNNCNSALNISTREYLEQQETLGTVLCYPCINSPGKEDSIMLETPD